jgi:hypothetical protein
MATTVESWRARIVGAWSDLVFVWEPYFADAVGVGAAVQASRDLGVCSEGLLTFSLAVVETVEGNLARLQSLAEQLKLSVNQFHID